MSSSEAFLLMSILARGMFDPLLIWLHLGGRNPAVEYRRPIGLGHQKYGERGHQARRSCRVHRRTVGQQYRPGKARAIGRRGTAELVACEDPAEDHRTALLVKCCARELHR